jgi:hypothetical protein
MQCYSERNERQKTPASQFICKTPTVKSNNPLQKYLDRPILTPLSKAEFKKHTNKYSENNPTNKFALKTDDANFNRRYHNLLDGHLCIPKTTENLKKIE